MASVLSVIGPPRPDQSDAASAGGVTVDDFYAYMPGHNYLFVPAREPWPAASVNARLPDMKGENGDDMKASDWLDAYRPVDQMTWAPGMPALIAGKLVDAGGWITRQGCNTFNLYREAAPISGDLTRAEPWLAHLKEIYPDNADHVVAWLAHRVQRPDPFALQFLVDQRVIGLRIVRPGGRLAKQQRLKVTFIQLWRYRPGQPLLYRPAHVIGHRALGHPGRRRDLLVAEPRLKLQP